MRARPKSWSFATGRSMRWDDLRTWGEVPRFRIYLTKGCQGWSCLNWSPRAHCRWSRRTVRGRTTVYTCSGWTPAQCARLSSPSSALVPLSSSCVWIRRPRKPPKATVLVCYFKWREPVLFSSGFCLLAVYLVGGFLYQRMIVGAKGMEQFPNYAFWVEVGNLAAVRPVQWRDSIQRGWIWSKNLLLSPFRMAVTLCAALELARTSPPTEGFLLNLQRTIRRSEMTTYYLCDLNTWKRDWRFHCVTAFFTVRRTLLLAASRFKSSFRCTDSC